MNVAISAIGLATAQANSPTVLPWEPSHWSVSRICYRAVDSSLTGAARWRALVKKAFADLGPLPREMPLFVGSCNGDASRNWEQAFDTSVLLEDTPWANEGLPVFSSSCASGLHALYVAKQLLAAGAIDDAIVLAADILSQSNHENFEGLRVLAERPIEPWRPASQGFILGEAAVILRLSRAEEANFSGPELGSDLEDHDGLSSVIEALRAEDASVVLGQGTGPYGHTLGASGLLSLALGTRSGKSVVACRAMNGACAAAMVGRGFLAKAQRRKESWRKSAKPGVMMNEVLKRLASEAFEQRPAGPPDVLILRMEKPLSPPPSAIIGGRLLPSAVLEITPGFASQLIARCWGFSGPSLCLVGDVDRDTYGFKNTLKEAGLNLFQVNLRGSGDQRVIEWNI